jgi:hypothetical protein
MWGGVGGLGEQARPEKRKGEGGGPPGGRSMGIGSSREVR